MQARVVIALLFPLLAANAVAQSSPQPNASLPDAPEPAVTLRAVPRNFLHDQASIWTSPIHARESNIVGPLLFGLATTVVATTDHQVMSHVIADEASLKNRSDTASQGLTGIYIALPVGLYGLGHLRHNEHAAETGLLGGEAILDATAVNQVIKIASRRERPTVDGARGRFFQSGVGFDSSFASNHAVIAWSSAAVIASEYPGWLTKVLVYGGAAGVSASRVLAQQHFPSDVIAASGVGWMIGRYVVRKHHRHSLGYY